MSAGQHHEELERHAAVTLPSDRSFGLVLTGFLVLLAVSPKVFRGQPIRAWALIAALVVVVCALLAPKILHPVTAGAMKFSLLAAKITNPIVLGLLYGLVFVPAGVAMRIAGKDPLRLKRRPREASYWIHRDSGAAPRPMQNQF